MYKFEAGTGYKQNFAKRLETLAIFTVISEHSHSKNLPPFALNNVVIDLVMTFKLTSNNIEKGWGEGVRNLFKISTCFQERVFRRKSQIFW